MNKVRSLIPVLVSTLFIVSIFAFGNFSAVAFSKPLKPPRPLRPQKIQEVRCKPLKPRWDGQPRSYPLSNPCHTLYNLEQIVENENSEETSLTLQNLLTTDLSQTYSQDEFQKAIDEASETFGEIQEFNFPSQLIIQGDWTEGIVEVITSKGFTQKFLVVFHREGADWKIFGTEEIGT